MQLASSVKRNPRLWSKLCERRGIQTQRFPEVSIVDTYLQTRAPRRLPKEQLSEDVAALTILEYYLARRSAAIRVWPWMAHLLRY